MATKPTRKRMTRATDTAEAKATKPEKQEAAAKQFADADVAAADEGEYKLRGAALGGY